MIATTIRTQPQSAQAQWWKQDQTHTEWAASLKQNLTFAKMNKNFTFFPLKKKIWTGRSEKTTFIFRSQSVPLHVRAAGRGACAQQWAESQNFVKRITKKNHTKTTKNYPCWSFPLGSSPLCFMYQIQQETISVVSQKNLISNIYCADKYQNRELTLFSSFGISNRTM